MRATDFERVCQHCGVPVIDERVHQQWHADLEQRMEQAATKIVEKRFGSQLGSGFGD